MTATCRRILGAARYRSISAASLLVALLGTPIEAQVDVGWEGIGPVSWSMDVRQLEAELGTELVPAGPREVEWCDLVGMPLAEGRIEVMVSGSEIARVDVRTPGPRAPGGIEVGALASRVEAVYPELRRRPHRYVEGEYLIVDAPGDAAIRLIFETTDGRVTRFRIGRVPEVDWVEGCS